VNPCTKFSVFNEAQKRLRMIETGFTESCLWQIKSFTFKYKFEYKYNAAHFDMLEFES